MARYEVSYHLNTPDVAVEIAVEPDEEDVHDAIVRQLAEGLPEGSEIVLDSVRALDEPWVSGYWGDMRSKIGDVYLMNPSLGNYFQSGDAELLQTRFVQLGYRVVRYWNGTEGCDTVSFQISNRRKPACLNESLPADQNAILCAPRPRSDRGGLEY